MYVHMYAQRSVDYASWMVSICMQVMGIAEYGGQRERLYYAHFITHIWMYIYYNMGQEYLTHQTIYCADSHTHNHTPLCV